MLKRLSVIVGSIALVAGTVLFLRPVRPAHAQGTVQTGSGTVTTYNTSWGVNQVVVATTATPINPASCSFGTGNGYSTDPNNSSVQESALLGALLAGKKVVLTLEGCSQGRPMILGVNVFP
jgi:hypothetical protein